MCWHWRTRPRTRCCTGGPDSAITRRARNLHKAAKRVANELQGQFPDTLEGLCELPGVGRSTAGAILSIACGQRASILDGNVKRVLARYHRVEGWPGQSAVHQRLWDIAEQYTPHERCADYTQAMMDLGATLCTRSSPACEICPLAADCQALAHGDQRNYPGKKAAQGNAGQIHPLPDCAQQRGRHLAGEAPVQRHLGRPVVLPRNRHSRGRQPTLPGLVGRRARQGRNPGAAFAIPSATTTWISHRSWWNWMSPRTQ